MIAIELKWDGVRGFSECRALDKTYSEYGRTQALALSNLCSKLARSTELIGVEWQAPGADLRGIVGTSIKKPRQKRLAEMDGFELHGGRMHEKGAKG